VSESKSEPVPENWLNTVYGLSNKLVNVVSNVLEGAKSDLMIGTISAMGTMNSVNEKVASLLGHKSAPSYCNNILEPTIMETENILRTTNTELTNTFSRATSLYTYVSESHNAHMNDMTTIFLALLGYATILILLSRLVRASCNRFSFKSVTSNKEYSKVLKELLKKLKPAKSAKSGKKSDKKSGKKASKKSVKKASKKSVKKSVKKASKKSDKKSVKKASKKSGKK
jgi:hypothetical protein